MAKEGHSVKHLQIDKANARMLAIMAAASAVTIFSLIASRSLLGQMGYQNKVIGEREKVLTQLESNVKNAEKLVVAYEALDKSASIIGTADANSKVVLDALPSKYDFPALATSLEKILTQGGYKITSINGVDGELSAAQDSASPTPIEMPFDVSASGSYESMQSLVKDFLRSIRPFNIRQIEFSGGNDDMRMTIGAKTYYQPQKSLKIEEKVVK